MHENLKQMLQKYDCHSEQEYINALKEIFQEIALLGLWRAKFYEKAAFYGGSALRILFGLDRFSEDLDFSLLTPDPKFNLDSYNEEIKSELQSFGFHVDVISKKKNFDSNIESAFIKADSKTQLIFVEAPKEITKRIPNQNLIKIKMEIDINPPGKFSTEAKPLLQPIPFFVRTFIKPDLFAGKVHALLCRPWVTRVKGRDWYDFVWYIGTNTPLNLIHLRERLIQSNAWQADKELTKKDLLELLKTKIANTDFKKAKQDIQPFIKDQASLTLWSQDFFYMLLAKIKILESTDS